VGLSEEIEYFDCNQDRKGGLMTLEFTKLESATLGDSGVAARLVTLRLVKSRVLPLP